MPSPEEVFTKEPDHTHISTCTLSRMGCLIIRNVTITRLTSENYILQSVSFVDEPMYSIKNVYTYYNTEIC